MKLKVHNADISRQTIQDNAQDAKKKRHEGAGQAKDDIEKKAKDEADQFYIDAQADKDRIDRIEQARRNSIAVEEAAAERISIEAEEAAAAAAAAAAGGGAGDAPSAQPVEDINMTGSAQDINEMKQMPNKKDHYNVYNPDDPEYQDDYSKSPRTPYSKEGKFPAGKHPKDWWNHLIKDRKASAGYPRDGMDSNDILNVKDTKGKMKLKYGDDWNTFSDEEKAKLEKE